MKRFLIVIVIISGLFAAAVWTAVFLSFPHVPAGTTFKVAKGEGINVIASGLKDEGIIKSELLFKMALRNSGLATHIQPGVHDLTGVSSYTGLAKALASGGVSAKEVVLLVKEGETLRDIKAHLEDLGLKDAAAHLYDVTGVPAELGGAGWDASLESEFPFLKGVPAGASLEGFLFPDTYRIFKTATARDVVREMLANTAKKLTPSLMAEVDASGHTLYQTITMASIIEREVRGTDDRRKVSDIFWRRLAADRGLQADSTVNYVTDKRTASISAADTTIDSPYNTYKYRGLPYGPICNPGLDAITAALNPESNTAWYFLTDAQGNVHYASTLDEQNRNKAKYLQ